MEPCIELEIEYEICAKCDHFIEFNEVSEAGLASHFHLDDGEKEYDHDATPSGDSRLLIDWRLQRPDLFLEYADGAIGPNSVFHVNSGS